MSHNIIYGFDLDGTLYDNSHRVHMIPTDRTDTVAWSAFNSACEGDTARPAMIGLVRSLLEAGADVRYLTGRGESARVPTMRKLVSDGILVMHQELTMRSMTDYRPAPVFKREVVQGWLDADPDAHVLMLEDDPAIVEALRQMDRVTVLQIDSLCADVRTK